MYKEQQYIAFIKVYFMVLLIFLYLYTLIFFMFFDIYLLLYIKFVIHIFHVKFIPNFVARKIIFIAYVTI